MDVTTNQNSGIRSPFIYNTSKALERASYYGIRSLLVLYMIGETFAMERTEALAMYGWFTTIYLAATLIGAVIGDLIVGNKYTAIIGGVMQTAGAFALCLPSTTMLYAGIGLVFMGSGVYGANLFSMIGRFYRKHEKVIDGGMTIYYTAISIGAFFGTLILGMFSEDQFYLAFILAGVMMLVSSVLLLFVRDEKQPVDEQDPVKRNFLKSFAMVFVAMALTAVFWMVYEIAGSDVFMKTYELREVTPSLFLQRIWQSINPSIVVLLGVLFSLLWYFIRMNRFLKLAIGLLFGALSYFILIAMPMDYSGFAVMIFFVSALLLGLAEILVAPTALSLIIKYTNPKYLAIAFALYLLPVQLLSGLFGIFSEHIYNNPNLGLIIGGVVLVLLAVGCLLYFFISKVDDTNNQTS